MRTLSITHPVARKEHQCVACGDRISKGAKHLYSVLIYQGDFQANRWHEECYWFAAETAENPCEWEVTTGDFTHEEAIEWCKENPNE